MLFLSLCPPHHNDSDLFPVALALSYSSISLVSQDLFFPDPLPAICFMLWLVHIRTHIYEVPYSPFERFLLMKSSFMFVFYPSPPLHLVCAHTPRSASLLALYHHIASPTPPLSRTVFSFCFSTHNFLLLRRRRPTLKLALSDTQSNAVCPVAVLYLDMVLFRSLKSTPLGRAIYSWSVIFVRSNVNIRRMGSSW